MIKKNTALILSIVILISAIVPAAVLLPYYFDANRLDMAIMSDIHVLSGDQMGTEYTLSLQEQEAKGQKMLVLSEALLKEGIDAVIAGKQEVLLVSGDLTDDGGRSSHEAVARELRRAEKSGVACYVINGNHDINNNAKSYSGDSFSAVENVNAEQFAQIYADFGYNEAKDRHADSLSYIADLNKDYLLLAVDCCYYGDDGNRHDSLVSDSLISWIENGLIKASEDNKKVLAMVHYPLAGHLTDLIDSNSMTVDKKAKISELFFKYGVNTVFTGHLHSQDIAAIQNDQEQTIYDVETASLCNYPMPIRYFVGNKKGESLTTAYLTSLKERYIPDFIPSAVRAQILDNLTAYAEKAVGNGMKKKIMNKIDTKTVLSLLGVFGLDAASAETQDFAEDIRHNLVENFFDTPLYKNGSGVSVEDICNTYGIALPSSDYTTVWSVAMQLLRANYKGNESYKSTDTEGILLKYSIFTAFYQIADYDLFGKLKQHNPQIGTPDLYSAMEKLFQEGKLELVDNGLLGTIGTVDKLARLKERWESKPFIGPMLAELDLTDSQGIMDLLETVAKLKTELDLDVIALLMGSDAISKYINLDKIFDFEDGSLDLAYIYDEMLFGVLGNNLITDVPPADDSLTIPA